MVKPRSLLVQGPNIQASDRAAPPGSPPLPLPGLWDHKERELVCPTGSDWSSECHIWRMPCPGPLMSRGPPGGGGAGASAGSGAGRAHSAAQWQHASTATAPTREARTLRAHPGICVHFQQPRSHGELSLYASSRCMAKTHTELLNQTRCCCSQHSPDRSRRIKS